MTTLEQERKARKGRYVMKLFFGFTLMVLLLKAIYSVEDRANRHEYDD